MMQFHTLFGATPLSAQDLQGLIPKHLTTQQELNDWEATNINEAKKWALLSRKTNNVLSVNFVFTLHKKMFGQTWEWAGTYRKLITNIGIELQKITALAPLGRDDDPFLFYYHPYNTQV